MKPVELSEVEASMVLSNGSVLEVLGRTRRGQALFMAAYRAWRHPFWDEAGWPWRDALAACITIRPRTKAARGRRP